MESNEFLIIKQRAEAVRAAAAINISGIDMNFKKTSLALAIAVSAFAAGTAQAATVNAGTISSSFSHVFNVASGASFADTINFSVAGPSTLTGSAASLTLSLGSLSLLDIAGLTVNVWNNSHPFGTTNFGSFAGGPGSYTFNLPTAGNYHVDITGTATGAFGGTYAVGLQVAAVPEPETYAMLLAGLGVMGAIARRRKQAA
jgi:hypothetical protein